jgi:hypothetical protein
MKHRTGNLKFHGQRVEVIQELCNTHNLDRLVDYGLNRFIYEKLEIKNIVGIELSSYDLTYGDNYTTVHGDYNEEVFNHLCDNTLYTYFCFNEGQCSLFSSTLSKLKKAGLTNSYMLLWKRYNTTQKYEVTEL